MSLKPLPPEALLRRCDPQAFSFETTLELDELEEIVGQDRAVEAVTFAIELHREGYNLFALGPKGIGKHTVITRFLGQRASAAAPPDDWCYVHNFADPQRPRALRLPAGAAVRLRDDMAHFADELRSTIPAAFESDRYRQRKTAIEAEHKERREKAIAEVEEQARGMDILILSSPVGLGLAPTHDGKVLQREELEKLPEADRDRIKAAAGTVEDLLEDVLRRIPRWEREVRGRIRDLDRQVTKTAVDHHLDELRRRYAELPAVLSHLDAVEADIVERSTEIAAALTATESDGGDLPRKPAEGLLRRYRVNVLVDNGALTGAPVVYEDHPTYQNLVGRLEHLATQGALVTDFTLVRAGALHRANGGYLILDGRELLGQPFAWDTLKRALRAAELRIESLDSAFSLVSTVSLEPEPIPLQVKVVLVGDRPLYYLLCAMDPDFPELFKVEADFEDRIERTPETELRYARLVGTLARREGLRPLERAAVGRVIEYTSRLAEDAERMSTHMRSVSDLIREADHFAARSGHAHTAAADVQEAIEARLRRAGRLREGSLEAIGRGTLLIETQGARVGQVNGLTVVELGESRFGTPTRITARVRLGRGEVVDIEREVELGGPIHSKGVLILGGFLGGRFGLERPLTLHASLVFEQSYGAVEGDSASLAELCALLSALAEVPIRQSLAVTGSVNQHGIVQPIGGVNEKIEGFFDTCRARGLADGEGVIVPDANRQNLMLRDDVAAACAAGEFTIFAVSTVDEAVELLTGLAAGERAADGTYPESTLNRLVEDRLATFAHAARQFASPGGSAAGGAPEVGPPI
ncbi:MAG TPA: ATP-binding protein [Candidatus Limnocylindrales bacterium]